MLDGRCVRVALLLLVASCSGSYSGASAGGGGVNGGGGDSGEGKGDDPQPAGSCLGGLCTDSCAQAEASRSYLGCSYWPTVTVNALLSEDFSFAVAVANTRPERVELRVASATNPALVTTTVEANSLTTIKLPWVAALKQTSQSGSSNATSSTLAAGGAYHLTSSAPVTVYQFNALEYVLPGDCQKGFDWDDKNGKCHSFSNDASLLLPEHALNQDYIVISRPTSAFVQLKQIAASSGFFAVVATKPGITTVEVNFAADTRAGAGSGIASYGKGQQASFKLEQWDVLQILSAAPPSCVPVKLGLEGGFCDLSATTDLTGTLIHADRPVAVFGGHDCANVPFDKVACDHLEEQLFPVKSWGKRAIVTHTVSSGQNPSLIRVVSAEDGNQVSFSPASVHGPISLDRGRFVELTTALDLEVMGSRPLSVVQLMVGQGYASGTPQKEAPGDPSMGLAVPVEQYRRSYRFLAPESYQQNYLNVVALAGAAVKLDGAELTGFTPVASTGYSVAKLKIAGGSHLLEASSPAGITVYGVGAYTSYLYPGGLDLKILLE